LSYARTHHSHHALLLLVRPTPPTPIYTLSLHDALPISAPETRRSRAVVRIEGTSSSSWLKCTHSRGACKPLIVDPLEVFGVPAQGCLGPGGSGGVIEGVAPVALQVVSGVEQVCRPRLRREVGVVGVPVLSDGPHSVGDHTGDIGVHAPSVRAADAVLQAPSTALKSGLDLAVQ